MPERQKRGRKHNLKTANKNRTPSRGCIQESCQKSQSHFQIASCQNDAKKEYFRRMKAMEPDRSPCERKRIPIDTLMPEYDRQSRRNAMLPHRHMPEKPFHRRWILPFLCALACALPFSCVWGQERMYSSQAKVIQFSGVVVNGVDSKPLPFSTIMILNKNRGTVADASGFFSFVAVIGDTVEFSTVGFSPRQLIIPDTIRHDAYSVVMPLEQDTIMLMETVIYPWPSREKFREAFLSLKLPETEADIIRKNFNLAAIRERAKHGKMDADMNYRSLMQQQTTQLYYQNQVTPNNLLNPFAWAQFIKQWRRRKEADKMIEQQSEGYQQYEKSSSYSDDYLYDE